MKVSFVALRQPMVMMRPKLMVVVALFSQLPAFILGHAHKTKSARILNWIFIVVCGVGNVATLVFQIVSSVQDANVNASS